MGPRLKLPLYVHAFIDRHGKARFYFRRAGFKRVPLQGLPWSPEFMEAYQVALDDTPRVEIGARRTKPGTVASAVAGYFGSSAFASLAETTRRTRRQILERFRAEHGDKGIARWLAPCRADGERQGGNTRNRTKFLGSASGAYAARARGRLARQ